MEERKIQEKLNNLAGGKKSGWEDKADWLLVNQTWLKKSRLIAIKIIKALKEQNLTQKTLAEKLEVSPQQINKILKGKENLTLETITKLEIALSIKLDNIDLGEPTIEINKP